MLKPKLIRITTIAKSLRGLLLGQLKFMSNHFDVLAIASPGDDLQTTSTREGVETMGLEMTRTISPLKDLKAVYQLYRQFKKEKPLIVHTHTPKAGTLGMIAAKLAGVPIRMHTVAGLPLLVIEGKKRKLLDAVEKVTYACATKVYPNSYGLYDIILANNYTSAAKLKVIGNGSSNGIDTAFFDPNLFNEQERNKLRNELHFLPTDFIFIAVGRIVKDKGINELIAAFKKLSSLHENVKLLILGVYEKHLDPVLPETEHEINNNPNIVHAGYQLDVRPYFAIADVLTFPSYREGFPNVVMQASAMNLNAIVSDINGCNEIIKDNDNGFIIPVKNETILFEKMEYLYLNPQENKRMAGNARKRIVDNYEREFVWGEILKEYKSLINEK